MLGALDDGVAVLTLNRPAARNALSDRLTPALRRMIRSLGARSDVGALVITGAGGAFCAGGDVKGMAASSKPRLDETAAVADLQQRQRTLTGALMALRIPTLAALPGPAAGAGLALALACDIRIAARSAFVSTGYARVGLSGDYGINWLLTRLVGTARARELMFTAARVDSATCERIGLVNRVVADDAFETAWRDLALSLASGSHQALAHIKDNLDRALDQDFLSTLDHEAELLVRANRIAIANQKHPDHQLRVDRRPADRAVERRQFAAQPTQIENRVNPSQRVIGRHPVFKAEVVEQPILSPRRLTHHRSTPEIQPDQRITTAQIRQARLSQQSRPKAEVCVP